LESTFDQPIAPKDAADAERLFEQRASVHVAAAHELLHEIASDLDPQNCGIGWWAPYPDDKRRIFIADYLVQCASSVVGNLVEAALHVLEAESAHKAVSAQMAHSLKVAGRGATGYNLEFAFPPATSLTDLLPNKEFDLHVAGFFRAIGSTMDTLAAVAVGVGGFEKDILQIHFRKLFLDLKASPPPRTAGGQFQRRISEVIDDAVKNAAPAGWLDWALDYRNMLVHRGRRTRVWNVEPESGSPVLDPRGLPIPRARMVYHLARDPKNSDIQAYFGASSEPSRLWNLLEEDGTKALRRTLEAVTFIVNKTCQILVGVWRERRDAPGALRQPKAQWPNVAVQPDQFAGFEPGSARLQPQALQSSPLEARRVGAAAVLNDAQRSRWRKFTG
jgi:hypothetical protein